MHALNDLTRTINWRSMTILWALSLVAVAILAATDAPSAMVAAVLGTVGGSLAALAVRRTVQPESVTEAQLPPLRPIEQREEEYWDAKDSGDEEHAHSAAMTLAKELEHTGRRADADRVYAAEARSPDPKCRAASLLVWAQALELREDPAGAEHRYREAMALQVPHYSYYAGLRLALMLSRAGRHKEAEAVKQATEALPTGVAPTGR